MKSLMSLLSLCALSAFAESAPTNTVPPAALAFEPGLFATPRRSALPAWIHAVGYEQGELDGQPPAWHGSASLPEGAGKVWIELDRTALNEDLSLTLLYERTPSADLAIQLCDAEGRVVALDLFKSVPAIAEQAHTDTFIVPVRKYPTATRIVLRRISGDVKLFGAVLGPVVTEQDNAIEDLLALSRRLGDSLSPESDLVRRIQALTAARAAATNAAPAVPRVIAPVAAPEALPPPTPIQFAGFEWLPLRTDFEWKEGALWPVPRARAGIFDYGHWGHGRAPTLVTHVGDRAWRNYSIELDACSTGVDPRLNPHALNPQFSGFSVMFRVVAHSESWNEKSWSSAYFYVANEGANRWWDCAATRNYYCDTPRGHFNTREAGGFQLAHGAGLSLDRKRGNHVRVDVQGDRVQVWFDGAPVCDVTEPRLHEAFEDITLDHGGVGVSWGFDTMGWVRNITIRPLP